ncbi:SIMPL domain-containing protein [Prolixibacteraceae bacterium Z1-6]|uniref:SIMPL domain-containing protein n=1 Tax=Draconibacterium aestuarii TaxID=2998507 RepID=A0A9X3J4T3_9BACT|nr:SIMPL domain-containing protein [Prolixibacteraceae bacterium Z1-6]
MKQLIIFFILATFAVSSMAQTEYPTELVVEGKSSIKLIPEQLIFNVRISATDLNYTRCTDLAIEKAQQITDEFLKNGIDKDLIKTMNYSIREIREYDNVTRKSVFKGYKAEIPVVIKTLFNNPKNDVIFEIIKNNFNADFNLNFALTPEQKEEAKEKLIAMAIEDAKQKADIIKEHANIKTYRIRNVQYGEPQLIGMHNRPDYNLQKESISIRGVAASGGITNTLNPSEIEMRTSVVIAWNI